MLTKSMTAVAVVLALGAAPAWAQEASGEGADAGAGAEAGADAGAEAGAEAGADAGAEGGAEAGATAEGGEAGEADTAGADAEGTEAGGTDTAGTEAGSGEGIDTGATGEATVTTDEEPVDPDMARVELGTLTCELEAVTNALIYAQESFGCTFVNDEGMAVAYDATIDKIGANLQIKTDQTLQWIVLSSVTAYEPEDLTGTYVGASAQASLGVGAGANVLIGGSGDNFTLQPLSVTGQEGLGASLTLDSLTLTRSAEPAG